MTTPLGLHVATDCHDLHVNLHARWTLNEREAHSGARR